MLMRVAQLHQPQVCSVAALSCSQTGQTAGTQNTAYCVTPQVAYAIKQSDSFFMVIAVASLWFGGPSEPRCIYRFVDVFSSTAPNP